MGFQRLNAPGLLQRPVALLVFGPKKLPELGKGLGESIRGFKSAMSAKEEEKPAVTKPDSLA